MTPCSFIWWLDDIFQPKRSGVICYERRDIIRCQPPNLASWENSRWRVDRQRVLETPAPALITCAAVEELRWGHVGLFPTPTTSFFGII